MKKIRELERFYAQTPSPFLEAQLKGELTKFETAYPKSQFDQEIERIRKILVK